MILITYSVFCFGVTVIAGFGLRASPEDCPLEPPEDESWNDTAVNYYVNLIPTEIEKAANYKLPKNNNCFLESSDSESQHIEFGEYDFIIVGGGTSGSTLAHGLSEITGWEILLLEAGGNETDFSNIPLFNIYLRSSRMNWGYSTTPQEHSCGGTVGGGCSYPRGKVEGGSGAINGLVYTIGNKNDYDRWAAEGNDGWSYEDVLPYFKQLEHSQIDGDPGYHGEDGLLNVAYAYPRNPLLSTFLDANRVFGRRVADYNGASQLGAARTQFTIANGRRESGGSVFLNRAKCRKNLHIVKQSLVTKILVDDAKTAHGIEFIRFGQNYTATARKEVILSAGSVNTPQLLLLSGIGPKEDLEELGIEVVHHLPGVGRNLQDHVGFQLSFTTNCTTSNVSSKELTRMYLAGFGRYTKARNNEAVVFLRLENSKLPANVPDIQTFFIPHTPELSGTATTNSFSFAPLLLHPKSRGHVTLSSKNPLTFPSIDTKTLYEEEDRQTLYQGVEATMELIGTEPFRKINTTFVPENIPECDQYEFRSRDYWLCNFKYTAFPGYHATSTTTMGTGVNAVVDDRLRVRGIENLRVVDCSVIPYIVSGNTNAAAFMIGIKASDIIKEDHFTSVYGYT